MAVFGSYPAVHRQLRPDPRFSAAFAYVAEALQQGSAAAARIGGLAAGVTERIELSGGAFALEQAYLPKVRAEGFFESHRKFIDVQVVVTGEELMEVAEITRLVATTDYNPERDLRKYAAVADASVLRMSAGEVAVFFPEDGHMPSLRWRGPGLVRKTVVKVPAGAL